MEDLGVPEALIVLGAVIVAGAAAALGAARLGRRLQGEAAATDRPPAGVGQPGEEHVQRSCLPVAASRRITVLAIRAAAEAGSRPGVTAELGSGSRANQAVGAAIAAQHAGDLRWREEKLDEAAARLVGAIDGSLPHDGSAWTVTVAGSWEGDRMRCTYRRWVCSADGHWPVDPAATWTGWSPDRSHVEIGTLDGCGRRHAGLLVDELRPLLARFVAVVAAD